jgi:hypothetical protein
LVLDWTVNGTGIELGVDPVAEDMMAKHRKDQPAKTNGSRAVDNTRGSPLWAFNYFRSQVLTNLLNDIVDNEVAGFSPEHCDKVARALEYFVNATTDIPGGGLLTGPIYPTVDRFAVLYREWNDIHGELDRAIEDRRYKLYELRRQRQKISDKARSLQYEIENNLDRQLLKKAYEALGDLITLVPQTFANLTGAIEEFLKRGGEK